jgi:hypothetical protein
MWIPKILWAQLTGQLTRAQADLANREQDLQNLDGRCALLQGTIDALRERLIKVESSAKSHQAYADVWRLQVNTLTETNAALLTQLIPTLTVKVPTVERAGVAIPSGLDFEDVGDAAALLMGLADEFPADPSVNAPAPPLGDIPAGRIVPGTPRVPSAQPATGLTDRDERP